MLYVSSLAIDRCVGTETIMKCHAGENYSENIEFDLQSFWPDSWSEKNLDCESNNNVHIRTELEIINNAF
jgi:hypothetical protein